MNYKRAQTATASDTLSEKSRCMASSRVRGAVGLDISGSPTPSVTAAMGDVLAEKSKSGLATK